MHEAVDAVAPHVTPAVAIEYPLDHPGWIACAREIDCLLVEEEWEIRIVRYNTIIGKHDRNRLSGSAYMFINHELSEDAAVPTGECYSITHQAP
jgi:hypothetical protein